MWELYPHVRGVAKFETENTKQFFNISSPINESNFALSLIYKYILLCVLALMNPRLYFSYFDYFLCKLVTLRHLAMSILHGYQIGW